MITDIALYVFSFFLIWYGSGLIISAVSTFSRSLSVSPFVFSFLFLGLLTSIPEFSVGLQATASGHTEIFIGNLLGGIIVLFLVVIPLLAIIGNGISVKNELSGLALLLTSGVILAPAFFVLDRVVSNFEGVIMIGMYAILMFFIQRNRGVLDSSNKKLLSLKKYSYKELLFLILGLGLVFISSRILLEKTIHFAEILGISAFYISLIVVALGTDMPEFILAIRSALQKKKDVAMGDYVGAAAASTLLFGVFTLLNGGVTERLDNFWITFVAIAAALAVFYFFSRSKQHLSRGEGCIMLGMYALFLCAEVISRST
jgi:cation:H+ antiporter